MTNNINEMFKLNEFMPVIKSTDYVEAVHLIQYILLKIERDDGSHDVIYLIGDVSISPKKK